MFQARKHWKAVGLVLTACVVLGGFARIDRTRRVEERQHLVQRRPVGCGHQRPLPGRRVGAPRHGPVALGPVELMKT